MNELTQNILMVLVAGVVGGLMVIMFNGLVGDDGQSVGAGTRFPSGLSADGTAPTTGQIRGTTLTVTGNSTLSGTLTSLARTESVSTDVTVLASESGSTFLIASGTTATLPAVTNTGAWYRFQVSGSITDTNFIIDSAEGDNIEGSVIVAGAVVDCAAEDQLNFVNDGENVGDFVELYSNGTSWLIGASNALTSAKLTCTDPS